MRLRGALSLSLLGGTRLRRLVALALVILLVLVIGASPGRAQQVGNSGWLGGGFWSPPAPVTHASECDGTFTHQEAVRVTPHVDLPLTVTSPVGVNPRQATLYYSVNGGTTQVQTRDLGAGASASSSVSGGNTTFVIPGASLPSGVVLDYAFEVLFTATSGACLGSVAALVPSSYGFHSVALAVTDASSAEASPWLGAATYAATIIGLQPQASGLNPQQVCSRWFLSPTPCDLFLAPPNPLPDRSSSAPLTVLPTGNLGETIVVQNNTYLRCYRGAFSGTTVRDACAFNESFADSVAIESFASANWIGPSDSYMNDFAEGGRTLAYPRPGFAPTCADGWSVDVTLDWYVDGRDIVTAVKGFGGSATAQVRTEADFETAEMVRAEPPGPEGWVPIAGTTQILRSAPYGDLSSYETNASTTGLAPGWDDRVENRGRGFQNSVSGTGVWFKFDTTHGFFVRFHVQASTHAAGVPAGSLAWGQYKRQPDETRPLYAVLVGRLYVTLRAWHGC